MTEAEIQKQIVEYLRAQNCTVVRINSGSAKHNLKLAPAGTPDLLVIDRYGRHTWIEVKGPKGKLREAQVEWINLHQARGVHVIVAYGLEDVQDIWD